MFSTYFQVGRFIVRIRGRKLGCLSSFYAVFLGRIRGQKLGCLSSFYAEICYSVWQLLRPEKDGTSTFK